MEATKNKELNELVNEAMLREIADSVGRRLARTYGSEIRGVSSVLNAEGVELHIHAAGPFQDIRMQFIDAPVPVRTLFDDVDDDEL